MGEFVGKQQTVQHKLPIVGKGVGGHAIVTGLMVFEAEVSDLVAQRYEEVIGPVVPALVERARLANQAVEVGDMRPLKALALQVPISRHVQIVFRCNLRS